MLNAKIESLLFVANRPMTAKRLAEVCDASKEEVLQALDEIAERFNREGSGVRLLRNGEEVQLATAPDAAKTVQDFLKDETTGEMTKPSLEALTIIAYRGPVAKAELEQIRGVNCSLILRNLMLRGLVETTGGEAGDPRTSYRVTMDFLRFLGVSSVEELPDYEKLHSHENVTRVLAMGQTAEEPESRSAGETQENTVENDEIKPAA
ncbi:MAG: SMC-Scp complex subunit ScpB [Patescibacteria group bacterium]|nr:SMC-Scp complex subunit ScpB [Patescibacteria group bacterium]